MYGQEERVRREIGTTSDVSITASRLNAIADAVGVEVFRRAPVTPDVTGDACMNR
jgi:hypothetical protein